MKTNCGHMGPHGDPFQLLGPYWVPISVPRSPFSLFRAYRDACKFNGDSISSQCLINCDNTNESHACLSVKSVLLQYPPPPPFKGFISMNYLVSLNFANICFLGPHSAAEGPHLVPISLKIGSPMGPLFDNLGSQWHVATVKTGSLTGSACKNQVQESSSEVGQIMSPIISTSMSECCKIMTKLWK